MTLAANLLLRHCRPQQVIYHTNTAKYTVKDVANLALNTARDLTQQGLQQQDMVVLKATENIDWIAVFWALALLGNQVVVVPDACDQNTWNQLLQQCNPRWVLSDRAVVSDHVRLWLRDPQLNDSVSMPIHQHDPDQPWFYWASSGTSGTSKLIAHSDATITASLLGLQQYWRRVSGAAGDKIFCPARLSSSMGCTFNILAPLALGSVSVLTSGLSELRNLPAMTQRHGINHLVLTPYVLEFVTRVSPNGHAPHLRSVTSAAESLPQTQAQRFLEKFGCRVNNLLGSSELLLIAMDNQHSQEHCVGQPMSHVQVRIVDEDNNELVQGEIGTIQVKSPSQFLGYLGDAVKTQDSLRQGWVHTHDMGYIDADGNLFLLGRSNSLVKIRGRWVSLVSIENAILDAPQVKDCVVVQGVDRDAPMAVTALVVTEPDSPDLNQVLASLQTQHHARIQIVPEIPRTVNMKKIRDIDLIQQHWRSQQA